MGLAGKSINVVSRVLLIKYIARRKLFTAVAAVTDRQPLRCHYDVLRRHGIAVPQVPYITSLDVKL